MPPPWRLSEVEPVMELWDGWDENIAGVRSMNDLPTAAIEFLNRLNGYLPCPILLVGTGPREDEIIVRQDWLRRL